MSQKFTTKNPSKPTVGVLCSGGGSNLQVLIDRARTGELGGEIRWVVSNNGDAFALERARNAGIEAIHASAKSLGSLEAVEAKMLELIDRDQIKVLVLAGYMKAIPVSVIHRLNGRVLNIHPALLPAFGGVGMYGHFVHEAVLASGAMWTGVTIHLVTEKYDEGPIVAQRVVAVYPGDTPESLGARVLAMEHDTLWREVRTILERP